MNNEIKIRNLPEKKQQTPQLSQEDTGQGHITTYKDNRPCNEKQVDQQSIQGIVPFSNEIIIETITKRPITTEESIEQKNIKRAKWTREINQKLKKFMKIKK